MATVDKTGGNSAQPWDGKDNHFVMSQEINLAGVGTGDVVQLLKVPAKTLVKNVVIQIVTPTGLTSTATIGDGDDANDWDASVDLNAVAGTLTRGVGGTDANVTTGGKLYTAEDTIDATCTITSGPIVTGKIRVSAECVRIP